MYKQEFKGLNISGNQHFSAFKVSYYRRNAIVYTHIRISFGRVWSARFYISHITACRESASFLDSLWSKKQLKVYPVSPLWYRRRVSNDSLASAVVPVPLSSLPSPRISTLCLPPSPSVASPSKRN